jgi:hypothetical protein
MFCSEQQQLRAAVKKLEGTLHIVKEYKDIKGVERLQSIVRRRKTLKILSKVT